MKNFTDTYVKRPARKTSGRASKRPTERLLRAVERAFDRPQGDGMPALQIERVAIQVDDLHPLDWLSVQENDTKLYWSDRDKTRTVAAIGVADRHQGFKTPDARSVARDVLPVLKQSDPGARYYGGIRFNPSTEPDDTWTSFGTYSFVLPRLEVVQDDESTELVCNLFMPYDLADREQILNMIRSMCMPDQSVEGTLPQPVGRVDVPDQEGWTRNVDWALDAFAHDRMDKVVLARRARFDFEEPVDPFLLMTRLEQATPDCFHFAFQQSPGVLFVGASPERLYRRQKGVVSSEAVAGTRPRGDSAVDDQRLRDELMDSDKDQREHSFVRDQIVSVLEELTSDLEVEGDASIMRLARGRHLVTRMEGHLRDEVTDVDLLHALHPTPAVCGTPTEDARAAIADLESFDRGWYAGPVGWIGTEGAEFAVAIRSGLVHEQHLTLFSGAGIVDGSDPLREWDEIETKISDFTNVLGLDFRHAER